MKTLDLLNDIEVNCSNKYIEAYFNNYIIQFRKRCGLRFSINIKGLGNFISSDDKDTKLLIENLSLYGFSIQFVDDSECIETLQIDFTSSENDTPQKLECNIGNLISIINLSSKTGISTAGIFIIKIVSRLICQTKILFKAIVLDLDDTLWKGTLGEEGTDVIKERLSTSEGQPYISFMQFVKIMAEELGIYVAICSKNDQEQVKSAIESLNECIFPLKGHIDYITANYNDKSENIIEIAQRLSILPDSVVFIDDNELVREEVKNKIPNAFVPEWNNHDDLITLLTICCAFDRYELSLKSRNRRKQFEIIQKEREKSTLPRLFVKACKDSGHKESKKLYAKSNQFKLVTTPTDFGETESIVFEINRENGDSLGLCSALTYTETDKAITMLNWAISCRYFEIGLEEYVLLYMLNKCNDKRLNFVMEYNLTNKKVQEFVDKYYGECITDDCCSVGSNEEIIINNFEGITRQQLLTLRKNDKKFNILCVNDELNSLKNNTQLETYE